MADALKPTDIVARTAQHLGTEVAGSFILMSIDQGTYCGLDEIGSAIWRCLDRPRTVAEVCDAMVASHRGDRDTIMADLLEFLSTLRDQQLIDVLPAGP